jgi:superfamily II DNA or RNA helicase
MKSFINSEDYRKAVDMLEERISASLIRKLLVKDCGKEFIKVFESNDRLTHRELCELLVEERGTELFANGIDEILELKEKMLRFIPKEEVEKLYLKHPQSGSKIETVGYMYKPLSQKKWVSGKRYAKDFVETIGFPKIFAGIESNQIVQKHNYEDIMPRMPEVKLKNYQVKMKNRMLEILNAESSNKNCMISLPTGGGKTRIAVEAFLEWMQRHFEDEKYLVWVAQSEELCEQCISCIQEIWSNKEFILPLRVYRYFSKYSPSEEELQGGVVVCNIQKIYAQIKSEHRTKVEYILKNTGAMIIDEAHRASTAMYDVILEVAKKVRKNELFPLCGLSATPGRTKLSEEGYKLINRFEANLITPEFEEDEQEYKEHPLQYFKDKGYLSLTKHIVYHGKSVYELSDVELKELEKDNDAEYPDILLKRIALDDKNNLMILDKICKIPYGKSTLIYTCTVKQAKFFSLYMIHKGYKSAFIDSETKISTRRKIIADFKKGEIQFLFNYGVLTTGFDAPKVEYIVLARPIRSEILYEQIIGRGIRGPVFGGTKLCTIMDFFDNSIIQGEPKSFERFKEYWDMDAEGNMLH